MRQALLALEISADHNVEKLVCAAEFDIGFDHDGVPALHDGVLNFMGPDRYALIKTVAEVLANKHLLKGDAAVQLDDLLEAHAFEPLAVENDSGPRTIEDFEGLFLKTFCIRHDLVVRQLRAGHCASTRVANHGGEVAYD